MASKKKHYNTVEKSDDVLIKSLNSAGKNPKKRIPNFLRPTNLFPLLIAVISVIIAGLVGYNHQKHVSVVKAMILAENRLKMASTIEHVKGYLDGVYTDLVYLSFDPDVKEMTYKSLQHIQSIFNLLADRRQIAIIHLIKHDFDSTNTPFLTFEYNNKTKNSGIIYSYSEDGEEFHILIEQIKQFSANPALKAQLSDEVNLCLKNPNGSFVQGLVFSVPIYSNNNFVGVVVAMIPSENIGTELERDNYNNMVILADWRQNVYGCLDLPDTTKNWFLNRFKTQGTHQFFMETPELFQVGKWTTIWNHVNIVGEDLWWLAYLYDKESYQSRSGLYWFSNGYVSSAGILITGFILVLLIYNSNKRHEEREQARKQIKNQNVILEKAVRDKQHEMELLMERLIRKEKLAAIGQISGNIAHELRNPLSTIKQSIFFLNRLRENNKMESSGSLVNKHLKLLSREIDSSNRVISDLLQMAKTGPLNKEQVDLHSVIDEVLDQTPVEKTTRLNIDLTPDPLLIWADPQQLRQVLTNLISNANQAISEEGKIKIGAEMSNGNKKCSIEIQDNGPGITPENLSQVFEPLYTSKSSGIGLGLSICGQIIENHGGTITMTSEIGKGTSVNIQLPNEKSGDNQ